MSERRAPPDRPTVPVNRYVMPRRHWRFFPRLEDESRHPRAWGFPAWLDARVRWVNVLGDLYARAETFPASISPQAGLLLHALVRNIRPRTAVEVGAFVGVSTIWMAAGLEEAGDDPSAAPVREGQRRGVLHVFDDFGPMPPGPWRGVEIARPRRPMVEEALKRAGLEHRVVLHEGDSSTQLRACREALRGPDPKTGGVDLAFLDGDHSVRGVLADLWALEPVLNVGGYVVLHDVYPEQCGGHEGPRHVIDHIRAVAQGLYEVCEVYTAPLNYGMAVLRRVG